MGPRADHILNESEWLTCTTPKPMLRLLIGWTSPRVMDVTSFPDCRASERKLRLFACACHARICHLLQSKAAQEAVELAERFADGLATAADLERAEATVQLALNQIEEPWQASTGAERLALQPVHAALALALQVVQSPAPKAAWYASSNAYLSAAALARPNLPPRDPGFSAVQRGEERAQADLLRCLFGTLLFRPLVFDHRWRTPDVFTLAGLAYQGPDFTLGPLLADALEDADCTSSALLDHLREPGLHSKGCWAVDAILGKK